MASTNEEIHIKVIDDGDGTRKVKRGFDDVAASVGKTDSAVNLLKRTLATIGVAFSVQQLIALADAGTRVRNSLSVVTGSVDELNTALQTTNDIANATGQPIEDIARLYARASLAAEGLKLDQSQVATLTENVAKALAIQGSSATQSAGALMQLGQALSTGRVMAEEFNSIMEGLPVLAIEIAKQFNVTTGQLKQMVISGQLSSKQLAEALLGASGSINASFAQTSRTLAQTFTILNNNVIEALNNSTALQTVMSALASVIIFLANNIDTIIPLIIYFASLWGINATLGMLQAVRSATLLTNVLGILRTSTGLFSAAWGILNAVLAASPIGITLTILAALGAAIIVAYQQSETFRAIVAAVWQVMQEWGNWIIEQLIPELEDLWTILQALGEAVGVVLSAFADLLGITSAAAEEIPKATNAVRQHTSALNDTTLAVDAAKVTAEDYTETLNDTVDSSNTLRNSTSGLSSDLDNVSVSFDNATTSAQNFAKASREVSSSSGGGGGGGGSSGGGGRFTSHTTRNFQSDAALDNLAQWMFVFGKIPAWQGGPTKQDLEAVMSRREEQQGDVVQNFINDKLATLQQKEDNIIEKEQQQIAAVNDPTKQRPVYVNVNIMTPNPNAFHATRDQVNRQLGTAINAAFANG